MAQQGKVFSYQLTLKNNKPFIPPTVIPMANGVVKHSPITTGGLGMTMAILRVPSCLTVDFNYLTALRNNKLIDYYEVRNSNSEIAFYWRQMQGNQTINLNVNLIQTFSGSCIQKPHTAYPYYNNDQPVWVLAKQ